MKMRNATKKTNAVKRNAKFGIFSLFTGAGFLDLGFEEATFVFVMRARESAD